MASEAPPSKRTTMSMDKIRAVETPPTKIVGDEMQLDPQKVIKAWADSADVLRDVAQAVRENQQDNELVKTIIRKSDLARENLRDQVQLMVRVGIVIAVLQATAVSFMVWSMLRIQHDSHSTLESVQRASCDTK